MTPRPGAALAAIAAKAAEILRVLLGELRTAGLEELAASVCEGSGDERVAGSEVVDEHP